MGGSTVNKALMYPIGLISADEAMFEGISNSGTNQNNYLYTGQTYGTLSPCYYNLIGNAGVFVVHYCGSLGDSSVSNTWSVRPVMNLRSDVALTGSGTVNDPFKMVGA